LNLVNQWDKLVLLVLEIIAGLEPHWNLIKPS
jgi:hypothetical protein